MESKVLIKFDTLKINKKSEEVFEKEFYDFKNLLGEEEFLKFKFNIQHSLLSSSLATKKIENAKIQYEKLINNNYTIDVPSLMNITLYSPDYKKDIESNTISNTTLGNILRNKDSNNNQLPLIISAGSNS